LGLSGRETCCALALLSCSSASGGLWISGQQGKPIPATNLVDTLVIPLAANGREGSAIVDTGSPILALDLSAFVEAGLPDGSGTLDTLTLGALTIGHPTVVGANLVTSPDPKIPVGGSLGCEILCSFSLSMNYRDSEVTLGVGAVPANVTVPAARVPFQLEGGGNVTVPGVPGNVVFPASRVSLSATLEGQAYSFVVDTGDSFVTVRESIFATLVADGRAEISGIATSTPGQSSTSSVTRLRSLSVGGESVAGLVASEDSVVEASLDAVAQEVGHPVDGLLGGSFLRQFYVTIDYASSTLTLQRYTVGGPTFDLFDRLGVLITTATATGPAVVSQVFSGTHAEQQGVAVGDQIVAVDGQPLAGLGTTASDELLSGAVGSSKSVQFGAAEARALSMKTVSILVDDILPL
jgi:hypothetical protein